MIACAMSVKRWCLLYYIIDFALKQIVTHRRSRWYFICGQSPHVLAAPQGACMEPSFANALFRYTLYLQLSSYSYLTTTYYQQYRRNLTCIRQLSSLSPCSLLPVCLLLVIFKGKGHDYAKAVTTGTAGGFGYPKKRFVLQLFSNAVAQTTLVRVEITVMEKPS